MQIQGQDGHIYKGRIDARLSVEMSKKPSNKHSHPSNSYARSMTNLGNISYPNMGMNSANTNELNSNKDMSEDQPIEKLPMFTNSIQ